MKEKSGKSVHTCKLKQNSSKFQQDYYLTRKFSPPTWCSSSCGGLKGPSGPKVILPDERTTGLRELDYRKILGII